MFSIDYPSIWYIFGTFNILIIPVIIPVNIAHGFGKVI